MRVLYLSRNDGTDMRVSKMCNSLARLGHEVYFVGWDRTPNASKKVLLDDSVQLCVYKKESEIGRRST